MMLQKHFATAGSSEMAGLASNFGDSFLMQTVQVYRNVRRKTLELGFSYSDKPDANYLAFPMSQLENVLASKIIPYTDNVTALVALNTKAQGLEWDHIVDNLKPNFVFHESCHAVARTLSQSVTTSNLQERLVVLLLEESFANACEFFAIADAGDQICRNFLEVNSYFNAFEDRNNLKKMIEKSGAVEVFKVLLLSYVHSNFLNEKISDSDFKKLLDVAGLNATEAAPLKSLVKNCFNLNPRFRYTTTEMYLRVNGISTAVEQALDFDYLQLVKNNSKLLELINSLSQIAGATDER
jgi:hypothetical protein